MDIIPFIINKIEHRYPLEFPGQLSCGERISIKTKPTSKQTKKTDRQSDEQIDKRKREQIQDRK